MTDEELDAMSADELLSCFAKTKSDMAAIDTQYSELLRRMQQIIDAKARKGTGK